MLSFSDVNKDKDSSHKDKNKDKDSSRKDMDKDKDSNRKDKDQGQGLQIWPYKPPRTRTKDKDKIMLKMSILRVLLNVMM